MSSPDQLRSRFLHKLGIVEPESKALTSSAAMAFENEQSCLGNVSHYEEPLKVCLDSDTESMDEDDDFYFGDDEEDFECMEYEVPVLHPEVPTTVDISERNGRQGMQQASIPPFTQEAESTAQPMGVISDESSHSSSHASLDSMVPSLASSSGRSFSTGCIQQTAFSPLPEAGRKKKSRKVVLRESVSVIPIPMRDEYSTRTRERLWTSAEELYLNAARNSIEFASEGWNWRGVTEDEHMILCQKSGEMIHPIHIHNLLMERGLLPEGTAPLFLHQGSQREVMNPTQEAGAS